MFPAVGRAFPGLNDATTTALPRLGSQTYPASSLPASSYPARVSVPTASAYGGYQPATSHGGYQPLAGHQLLAGQRPAIGHLNGAAIPASEVPAALRGPEKAEEKKHGLLGVSGNQVVAGALAAATSAVAASYLGVAGTVVGAGLGSVIATVSTAVYQKSIQRSNRVLQKVTTTVVGKNGELHDAVVDGLSESRAAVLAPDPHLPTATQVGRGLPDPYLAETPQSQQSQQAQQSPATGTHPPAGGDPYALTVPVRTPKLPTYGKAPTYSNAPTYGMAQVPPPTNRPGKVYGGEPWYSGLPWMRILAASAAVFILVMGVITVVEVWDKNTLAATVRGEKSSGTTVGSIGKKKSSPTPTPSDTATEESSPTDSPTDEVSPSDSASPSDSPSDEVSPSDSASGDVPESPLATDGQSASPTEGVEPQPQVQTGGVTTAPSATLIP